MASSVWTLPRLEYVAVNFVCVVDGGCAVPRRRAQFAARHPDGDGVAHVTVERADAVQS